MNGRDSNSMPLNEELLFALIEGELDAARETAALAGLDAATASRVSQMRRQRELLCSAAEISPPAGLLDRVGAALEREALVGSAIDVDAEPARTFRIDDYHGEYRGDSSGRLQRRLAMAAAFVLLAGGVGYWSLWLSSNAPTGTRGTFARAPGAGHVTDDAAFEPAAPAVSGSLASRPEADSTDGRLARVDPEPMSSPIDLDEPIASGGELAISDDSDESGLSDEAIALAAADGLDARGWDAGSSPQPLGVFNERPRSLDLDDAARLAEQGLLVIRVRADRPGIAAAKLLAEADNHAGKGRIWRLMPCPPADLSDAIEAALPPDGSADEPTGMMVPYRGPMRPTIETAFSVELEPSAVSIAVVQAELEAIAEGAVILDVLDRPVRIPPPCGDDSGLRGWSVSPTSITHTVVVAVVVESEP